MQTKDDVVSYSEIENEAAAKQFLMQAPPAVNEAQAVVVAQQQYGLEAEVKSLNGERDRNFLLKLTDKQAWVLKIINQSEQEAEIDVQIQVLQHLQAVACGVQTPVHLPSKSGQHWVACQFGANTWKVRTYSFLEGTPVNQVAMTPELQHSFGQTAAKMAAALQTFDHPVLARVILWDVMRLAHLQTWAQEALGTDAIDVFARQFIPYFAAVVLPKLQQLPQQAIHGDLSQSNLVVDAQNPEAIVGVLDFGDMVKAPRIIELGIAASYALDTDLDVGESLQHIVAGFESVCALSAAEKALLLEVVIARLVQRIVISTWRAQRFPDNAMYILRGTAHAKAVLTLLLVQHSLPSSHFSESAS